MKTKKLICISLTFILAAFVLSSSTTWAMLDISDSKCSVSVVKIDWSDSANYHGYSLRGKSGDSASFTETSKLSEQYSGTGWHYKFAGKVSGKIKVKAPVELSISLPEKILGCQIITTKSGNTTKKYRPSF